MEGQADLPLEVDSQAVGSTQSEQSNVTEKVEGSLSPRRDSLGAAAAEIAPEELSDAPESIEEHGNNYVLQESSGAYYDRDEGSVTKVDDVETSDPPGSATECFNGVWTQVTIEDERCEVERI